MIKKFWDSDLRSRFTKIQDAQCLHVEVVENVVNT